ncbi:MAG TPA: glycoside hydrolase family 130 protein, partial [Gemmatimonadaceae bacterium]|nr:glycoside hydrolase family 130 protein [Gemmatimonadaceae bacterium]
NPIITPAMVLPSRPDFEVLGVFNPAVARHDGQVVLLLRVAEAPRKMSPALAAAPIFNAETGRIEIKRWQVTETGPDVSDPRLVVDNGRTWLTSMSHLRVARSTDGIHFDVEGLPALVASNAYEAFGIEDPRITLLDGVYWITYTAVSRYGIGTGLASTTDFREFERHGVIFPPPNRNVTIFPEKIGGLYAALHRPMPEGLGQHSIWTATSSDLKSWGNHRLVATPRESGWDDTKVGGGAVPFRVHYGKEDGWLSIYHGVTGSPPTYSLGALLLNRHDPSRVRARSREPILKPEAPYEREGFFGSVVFTCGALTDGDLVRIYYGAADGVVAVADLSLAEILSGLVDA